MVPISSGVVEDLKDIAMVVPVLNRFDMFTEMMETVDYPVQPIVIDQWRNNRGVSWAWNEGMRRAKAMGYQHCLIANDDLKFRPESLERLSRTIETTGAALVSPNQVRDVKILSEQKSRWISEGIRAGADFFCFMVDIDQIVEKAGWFDENFFPAYFEDNDMHRRMISAGLESYVDTDCPVFHEGSMTQKFDVKSPNVSGDRFVSLKNYYCNKWGGPPGTESYETPFNHPDLTRRDWNGSIVLDGLETSPQQVVLDSMRSLCYDIRDEIPQHDYEII